MSSNSYPSICPRCESKEYVMTKSTRPDSMSSECYSCGYYTSTEEGVCTLQELNELRAEQDMPEIKAKDFKGQS